MIPPDAVAACADLQGVAALLRELGWDVALRPLDPGFWRRCNVAPLPDTAHLFHASRHGPIELFVAEGTAARDAVAAFTGALSSWNLLLRFVTVYRDSETGSISIFGTDGKRRLRRIDLDRTSPRAEALARAGALELRGTASSADFVTGLERAFEKESVGRKFFLRFRDDVARLSLDLARACPAEDPRALAAESLLILSRILFLCFIQEKGWLDGNRAYLSDLVRRSAKVREGMFSGVFLPLFFGCLNTPPARRDPFARKLGRVPYLNGGLFEPSAFERRHPVIGLDDAVLESILFDTFERFQFTIEEDDETGAHIDPEMLGRVFETLMAEDERAESGSFYTPREVVDVLTARAIAVRVGRDERRAGAVLARWAAEGEAEIESIASRELLVRLRSIRILDPACGSGAFLLAALHSLEGLERRICEGLGIPPPAGVRRRIVARSLHGIDLKPEAVRLCELRLWLAIASAHDGDSMEIEPLPNLDRNILQGNALIGPLDFAGGARFDLVREWSFALRAREGMLERYRVAAPAERRSLAAALRSSDRELALAMTSRAAEVARDEVDDLVRRQGSLFGGKPRRNDPRIAAIEARIEAADRERARIESGEIGFFAPDVHFAHVERDGGFDLVLGNPPWVRAPRIEPSQRKKLAERYPMFGKPMRGSAIHQGELALAFFEKSLRLAAPGGVVALLVPAKVATADYAARFRSEISRHGRLVEIRDWSERARSLFDADTFPLGVVLLKGARPATTLVVDGASGFAVPQRRLGDRAGGPWILAPAEVRSILDRLRDAGEPFATRFAPPIMGIKTGANLEFFVEPEIVNGSRWARLAGIEVPIEALCRVVRGRDVRRWSAHGSVWMLWPRPGEPWFERWRASGGPKPASLAYSRPAHFGSKVVWKDISRGMSAAAVPPETEFEGRRVALVPNQTVYCAEVPNMEQAHLAAALLNSTLAGAWLASVADRAKDSHFRYFGRTVAGLPVPQLDREAERRLAGLAGRAAAGARVEREIDLELARAFEISDREMRLLGEYLERRLGRV
ncbi:MAG TPA: DNA methyltransferase [Thermoanaerobaculia bacterium]|nr:DNA methyltransferase [Thermoanaerobaculia bacterium]